MSSATERRIEQLREAYEERAAIKEFCGNVPREQAEKEAFEEVYVSGIADSDAIRG